MAEKTPGRPCWPDLPARAPAPVPVSPRPGSGFHCPHYKFTSSPLAHSFSKTHYIGTPTSAVLGGQADFSDIQLRFLPFRRNLTLKLPPSKE